VRPVQGTRRARARPRRAQRAAKATRDGAAGVGAAAARERDAGAVLPAGAAAAAAAAAARRAAAAAAAAAARRRRAHRGRDPAVDGGDVRRRARSGRDARVGVPGAGHLDAADAADAVPGDLAADSELSSSAGCVEGGSRPRARVVSGRRRPVLEQIFENSSISSDALVVALIIVRPPPSQPGTGRTRPRQGRTSPCTRPESGGSSSPARRSRRATTCTPERRNTSGTC